MKDSLRNKVLIYILIAVLLFVVVYGYISVFVVGVAEKNRQDVQKDVDAVQVAEKGSCKAITRHSFAYITYTCETKDEYVVYSKEIKKIASRDKKEIDIQKAMSTASEEYPYFKGITPMIGYSEDNVVYVFEKGSDMLLLDLEEFKVVFRSEGK